MASESEAGGKGKNFDEKKGKYFVVVSIYYIATEVGRFYTIHVIRVERRGRPGQMAKAYLFSSGARLPSYLRRGKSWGRRLGS